VITVAQHKYAVVTTFDLCWQLSCHDGRILPRVDTEMSVLCPICFEFESVARVCMSCGLILCPFLIHTLQAYGHTGAVSIDEITQKPRATVSIEVDSSLSKYCCDILWSL